MAAYPSPHIIHPESKHQYTIILIHGRGSTGEDFADEFLQGRTATGATLQQRLANQGIKYVFPSASLRYSTPFQEDSTEWFDIMSLSNPEAEGETQIEGIRESMSYLNGVIDEELKHVPAERIVLERFAGFIGMSGWLPFRTQISQAADPTGKAMVRLFKEQLNITAKTSSETLKTPVWASHTKQDNVVESEIGARACETLRVLGMEVQFLEFEDDEDDAHWLQEPEGYEALSVHLARLSMSL